MKLEGRADDALTALAAELGLDIDDEQRRQLDSYAQWLIDEAIPAGGLGPREADRIWSRHILDSIAFAAGFEEPPLELLDVGSGVGLPGIPLSILWPECYTTLLDRGGRRVRLLQRAVRILALPRVRVAQADVFSVADEWHAVTYRGSVKPQEAVGLSAKLLELDGTAVLGLSRRAEPPDFTRDLVTIGEMMGLTMEVRSLPEEPLDGPAWLLIMRSGE